MGRPRLQLSTYMEGYANHRKLPDATCRSEVSRDLGRDTSCYVSVLVPRTPKIVTLSFHQLTDGKSDLSYLS